jgi:protein-tyrosine phosphatase
VNFIRRVFASRYGTERGYVRHLLALFEYHTGTINGYKRVDFSRAERIVYVCLGNICRSAYAHHYSVQLGLPVSVASLGLSTTTGESANGTAMSVAKQTGLDMTTHQATDFDDFQIMAGDVYLAMEIRQVKKLSQLLAGHRDVQIGLLGNYCTPLRPHLHDPFTLSEDYFHHCFKLIQTAVQALKVQLTAAGDR